MTEPLALFDWFDIRRYAPVESWNLGDWFWAISNRLAMMGAGMSDESRSSFFEGLATDLARPNGHGYLPTSLLRLKFFGHDDVGSVVVDISADVGSADYYRNDWRFLPALHGATARGDTASRFVAINLNAPDSVLHNQFSDWLALVRRTQDPDWRTRAFSDADMRAWYDSQMLPYIDLCLWRDLYKVKLTQPQIGALLFPDDYGSVDIVERVRKVTARHAERLTSTAGFAMLEAQAADFLRKTATLPPDTEQH